jgi:DNA-directed RNA polymerase specialized sigma24 family protein
LYRIAHNEAYSLFRKRRPDGETEELQPQDLEGAATVCGNAVFPVELTLAPSTFGWSKMKAGVGDESRSAT